MYNYIIPNCHYAGFLKLNCIPLNSKVDTLLWLIAGLKKGIGTSRNILWLLLPFSFGLLMWVFFLCVSCVTILSALFSGIRRGVEKNNHHSTCQPKVQLHEIDGLRQEALLTGKLPSIDMTVNKHMGACLKLLL